MKHFEVSYVITHRGTAIVKADSELEARQKFDDYAENDDDMNALTVFRKHLDAEVEVKSVQSLLVGVDPGKVDIS